LSATGEGCKRELDLIYSLLEEVPAGKWYKQLFKILTIKVKVILKQATKVHTCSRGVALSFFKFGLRWGGWLKSRPGRFNLWERQPVPPIQKAGWAPGPVWTGAKNLATHWDAIPGPTSL
jgi:hypothetical protein